MDEKNIINELIDYSLIAKNFLNTYFVYFDKENGDILSISNEPNSNFPNFIQVDYDSVSNFLNGKHRLYNYKVFFVDLTTPKIVSKHIEDIDSVVLTELSSSNEWNCMLTVENYPLLKKWGFCLKEDQKDIFKNHNLNSNLEMFIVNKNNYNFLYRSIKVSLKNLLDNKRWYVDFESDHETQHKKYKVIIKKFFTSVEYKVLYDTNI